MEETEALVQQTAVDKLSSQSSKHLLQDAVQYSCSPVSIDCCFCRKGNMPAKELRLAEPGVLPAASLLSMTPCSNRFKGSILRWQKIVQHQGGKQRELQHARAARW
jgi:hypothetical protein